MAKRVVIFVLLGPILVWLSWMILQLPDLFLKPGGSSAGPFYEPQVGQEGKDVVWVPTPQEIVDRMLDIAGAKPGDYVIDLGSGDGRTVITAAKRGIRALGVDSIRTWSSFRAATRRRRASPSARASSAATSSRPTSPAPPC